MQVGDKVSKPTAVEWLENILHDFIHPEHGAEFAPFVDQAKEMEKQQIIEAYKQGQYDGDTRRDTDAEQYYNETYGK